LVDRLARGQGEQLLVLTLALVALVAPASTQALQPLIWLAQMHQLKRLPRYTGGVHRLEKVLDACRDVRLDACCHLSSRDRVVGSVDGTTTSGRRDR
jgi:hypothetical protein